MPASFLCYDLETFGRDPRRTRIAQFAAIRTDDGAESGRRADQPVLPARRRPAALARRHPDHRHHAAAGAARRPAARPRSSPACIERDVAARTPARVGYNSIRFDDEFIRYGLYRNFHDAYEREWRNGNSRWDLLDVMRLMHALRPEGMQWPQREDGVPSFKLEHLAAANGVRDRRRARGAVRRARPDRPGAQAATGAAAAVGLRADVCATSAMPASLLDTVGHDAGAAHLAACIRPRASAPRWCCRWRGIRASTRG